MNTQRALPQSTDSVAVSFKLTTLLLALPAAASVLFVALYATPMPLTDEWLFLRGVMRGEFVWKIYDHVVAVPYLVYWPLAQVTNFDNRALVLVTLVCLGTQTWIFRRHIIGSALWTLPVAVIMFSPAHYMEMQWGFQFTLAMSATLPIVGLALAPRSLSAALAFVTLGALSSAGGAFGYIALIALIWLRPLDSKTRITVTAICGVAVAAFSMTFATVGNASFGAIKMLQGLVMLGAPIWSMPVAFMTFSFDTYAATGLLIASLGAVGIVSAWRSGSLPEAALPIAILIFSGLASAATVSARAYLGNWHLQYALSGICAVYALCYLDRSWRRITVPIMIGLVALSLSGYHAAFTQHGPSYLAYVRSIEDYARRVTAEPSLKKPFPVTGGWDFDAKMAAFLRERGHRSMIVRN